MKQSIIKFPERKRSLRNKSLSPKKTVKDVENVKITRSVGKARPRTCLTEIQCDTEVRRTPRRSRKPVDTDSDDEDWQTPTPSKRKCLSYEKARETPSAALAQLSLKCTKEDDGKSGLKPKALFNDPHNFSAGKAFYSSFSEDLPCRERELEHISTLLLTHLKEKKSGSIYVSGLPGTGKTASLNKIVQMEEVQTGYHIVQINCTSVKSSSAVYKRICQELNTKLGKTEKSAIDYIEKYLCKKHKMILMILDEIDQLETKSQSILYKIFEWPSWPNSRIVLLGIANAMDMTDRILPRLCSRVELKPVLVHFAPYSKDQIATILKHRLSEAGGDGVFGPGALELLSAKVASMSGDIRRALDLGRRVLEVNNDTHNWDRTLATVEGLDEGPRRSPRKALQTTPCKGSPAVSQPTKSPRRLDFGAEGPGSGVGRLPDSPVRRSPRKPAPSVTSKHVLDVVKNLYGPGKNFRTDQESTFPLHQKLLLCSFLLILKKAKNKDVTVARLHLVYSRVCSGRGIGPVDQSGFLFLCRQLEMAGIVALGKGAGRLAKLTLQWSCADLTEAVRDLTLLSSILDDDKCLA